MNCHHCGAALSEDTITGLLLTLLFAGQHTSAVLAKALAREANDRYDSIESFAAAMTVELERVGVTDPRSEIERFLSDQDAYAAAVEPMSLRFPSMITNRPFAWA